MHHPHPRTALALLLAVAAAASSGCVPDQRYITSEAGGPWLLPIDRDTPAYFESEDANLYLVEQRIEIPFREPTDEELAEMGEVGDLQVPYAQLPFVRRGDIELQVDFTLSSLDVSDGARPLTVTVRINGFNEFHEYDPQAQVIDDDLVIDYSQWERSFRLQPGERVNFTVRQQELDEVAVDLAAVANGAPNSHQIVYFENQTDHDERSQLYVPDLIPSLTGIRVGVLSAGEDDMGAIPILLEATLRVRDERKVLVQGDDEPWATPTPALFTPMVVEED